MAYESDEEYRESLRERSEQAIGELAQTFLDSQVLENALGAAFGAREKAEEENKTSESVVTPEQVMQRWFAENARIYLNPGHSYGTGGSGRMRMNLATSRVLVQKALDNLAEAVASA